MLLDQCQLHIRVASHLLDLYQLFKLMIVQRLHRLLVEIEVVDCQGKGRVDLLSAFYVVAEVVVVVADEVLLQGPFSCLLIVYGCLG